MLGCRLCWDCMECCWERPIEFCRPRDLLSVMRGFMGPEPAAAALLLPPGVADGCRGRPAAGVLPEPLSRIPKPLGLLLPCAALPGVVLAARAGVDAAAAGRGVAKPPATAGGAVLGAVPGVAAAAAGAGVPAADAGGLLLCPLSANLRGPVLGVEAGVASDACCGVAAAWLLLPAPFRLILDAVGVLAAAWGVLLLLAPLSVRPNRRGAVPGAAAGRAASAAAADGGVACAVTGAGLGTGPLPTGCNPLACCDTCACEGVFLSVSFFKPPPPAWDIFAAAVLCS